MPYAPDIAAYAYIAMACCILLAEVLPWRKPAITAAFASIVFASAGSTAWCYAAFYNPGSWPEIERPEKQASNGGNGEEAEGDAEEGQGGGEGREGSGASGDGSTTSGAIGIIEKASLVLARKAANAFGVGTQHKSSWIDDGGVIKDCEDCPDLVTIPAGTALIGAADDDARAGAAERPARLRRFWPGFRIGREAVTAASFAQFLGETARPAAHCLDEDTREKPGAPSRYARCVSAAEADAYVAWLTGKTGKRYRLATAAEWEFAAKTALTPVAALGDATPAYAIRFGDVRELVADCWHPYLPATGDEVLAASAGRFLCESRMLKGWSEHEPDIWRRVSARREFANTATPEDIGLRVVRGLN